MKFKIPHCSRANFCKIFISFRFAWIFFISIVIHGNSLLYADDCGVIIGAIRWDAWVGDLNNPTYPDGVWNELALSPAKYHDRLPFYSEITNINSILARYQPEGVRNRAMPVGGWEDQLVMDAEIQAASGALDYWAFLDYPDWGSIWPMHTHLALYLSSAVKQRMNFSIIMSSSSQWWNHQSVYLGYLAEPSYQKVMVGGISRPLVFIYQIASWWSPLSGTSDEKWADLNSKLVAFTNASIAQGSGVPYYVCMDSASNANLAADKLSASAHGTPALSQYYGTDSSYQSTGKQLVPCQGLGWDGTPRKDLWTNSGGTEGSPGWANYGARSAKRGPEDLIALVKSRLVDFTVANSSCCESRATLLYAWNEFSEGGYICPTYYDGDERLRVMRNMRNIRADYRLNNNGADLSAAQATLTLTGGASFGAGRNGPGLVLDGITGYASAASNPTFFEGLNQMTVACWVKVSGYAADYSFPLCKGQSYRIAVNSTGAAHFAVATTNNPWYTTGTKVNFGTLTMGNWYHLAATYDGQNVRTYVNGIMTDTGSSISGLVDPGVSSSFLLGAAYGATTRFKGSIDEVAIWKTALSGSEITKLYETSFKAGYWPLNSFDEYAVSGYPRYSHDASRNSNIATPQGGFSSVLDCDAKVGQALQLDGISGYEKVLDAPPLSGMAQLSVSCWVKIAGLPSASSYPLSKDLSYRIAVGSTGICNFTIATTNKSWGAQGTKVDFGTLATNTWYHLAATYDGSNIRTYVNGVLSGTGSPISGPIISSTSNLCFGASSSGTSNFFNGNIDEVTIYNKVLSPQEVLNAYNTHN